MCLITPDLPKPESRFSFSQRIREIADGFAFDSIDLEEAIVRLIEAGYRPHAAELEVDTWRRLRVTD